MKVYESKKPGAFVGVCRDLLRNVHPDKAGDRVYTADEVTTMLNAVRESVRE